MPQIEMKLILAALLLCGHASYAQNTTVVDVQSGCDEEFSGNGADYRGCQSKTRKGCTCQDWSAQTPRAHPTITPALYPNSGLVYNFCRNPNSAGTIWCYTLADCPVAVDFCDSVGPRSSPSRSPVRSPSPRRSASPKTSPSPVPSESPDESDSPSSSESQSESPDESESQSPSPVPSPSPSPPTPSPSPSPHYAPDIMELANTPAELRLTFHFSMQYIVIVPFINVSKPLNVYFTCDELSEAGFAVPPTFSIVKYRASNGANHAAACSAGIKMIYTDCGDFFTSIACRQTILAGKFQTMGTGAGSVDLTYSALPSPSPLPSPSRSRSTSQLASRSKSPRASASPSISYSPSESPDESDSPSTSESAEESDSPSSSPSTSPDESESPSPSPDESDSPSSSQSQSRSPSPQTPSPSPSPVYDPVEIELAVTPRELYLNYSYSAHNLIVIPFLNASKPIVVYFKCKGYTPEFAMPQTFPLIEYHRTNAATHAAACAGGIKMMFSECETYSTVISCSQDLSGKYKVQSEAGPGYVDLNLVAFPSPSASASPRRSPSPPRSPSPTASERSWSRSMSRQRSPSRSRFPSPSPEESNSPSPVSASRTPSRSRSPSPRSPSRSPSPRKSKYNEVEDAEGTSVSLQTGNNSDTALYGLFVMIPMTVVGVLVAWKWASKRKQQDITTTLDFQPDLAGERVMPCPSVDVPMASAMPSTV